MRELGFPHFRPDKIPVQGFSIIFKRVQISFEKKSATLISTKITTSTTVKIYYLSWMFKSHNFWTFQGGVGTLNNIQYNDTIE